MERDIPCPVQRALKSAGRLSQDAPLLPFADLIIQAFARTGPDAPRLKRALWIVGATANGLSSVARNLRHGFRPHELRDGPFDKHGAGSRIYTQDGRFDVQEFERFASFAKPYPAADGAGTELGWGAAELEAYLDANQERSGASWYQRKVLMNGELPVLLQLMGQGRGPQRHLVVSEVRDLYEKERFPPRIMTRLADGSSGR